jgi:hypothetical protein
MAAVSIFSLELACTARPLMLTGVTVPVAVSSSWLTLFKVSVLLAPAFTTELLPT